MAAILTELFDAAGRVDLGDLGHIDALLPDAAAVSEDRAGLVRKEITNKAGHKQTVYVRPGETHPDEAPARAGETDGPPAAHLTAGLAAVVAKADPAAAKSPGLMKRLGDAAAHAGARVYLLLLRHHDAIEKAGTVLGAVLDLPSDMRGKFAYQPTTSSGTAAANPAFDPARAAGLPVSGHIVATVAAAVLVKGLAWAKGRLAGKAAEALPPDALAVLAEALFEAMSAVAESLGVTPPDRAAVEALVRALGGRP